VKYIIEHLEDEVWEWCILEYKHMSEVVGKENLIFTNVPENEVDKLKDLGEVKTESVLNLNLNNTCILDMNAEKELSSSDKFNYFVFGGILGDNPPQGRTKVLDKLNTEKRSLGKEQMSTDTAVMVTHMVLNGKKLKNIEFQDTIEFETNKGESVVLPYRYVIENGKPVLPKGLFEMLKKQEGL